MLRHDNTRTSTALLLIDVVNDFNFEDSEQLLEQSTPIAPRLAALKERAVQLGIPAIYVNDNFGLWRSDVRSIVAHCLDAGVPSARFVQPLQPLSDDYFVIKPKNSGFYQTTLQLLLDHLGVATLILTGIAADNCVLFTANDAYMRDYRIVVPADCIAARTAELTRTALEHMSRLLKADITSSDRLDLRVFSESGARSASRPTWDVG